MAHGEIVMRAVMFGMVNLRARCRRSRGFGWRRGVVSRGCAGIDARQVGGGEPGLAPERLIEDGGFMFGRYAAVGSRLRGNDGMDAATFYRARGWARS